MKKYFYVDLEEAVLADHSRWEAIRSHERVKKNHIPTPLSNKTGAREMRVAAVLAILGSALAEHVFQPTYLLKSGMELWEVMAELAIDDPARESYLRSVLLDVFPGNQKTIATQFAGEAADEVFNCVKNLLLTPQNREAFQSALSTFCKLASEEWIPLQFLQEKIEPNFDTPADADAESWRFPLQSATNGTKPRQRQNDTSSSSVRGASDRGARAETTQVAGIVWPAFVSIWGQEDPILLRPGYVIVEDDMFKTAKDAEAPLVSRRVTTRGRRESQMGTTNRSRSGARKSFLSSGGGSGSKDG